MKTTDGNDRAGWHVTLRNFCIMATICALNALIIPQLGQAQDVGGFRGRVTDPAGAAVPGATITVTEQNSNWTRSSETNEVGDYEVRGILPGTYTIQARQPGFREYINRDVVVYARQVRRVDVSLELGDVTESITVEAEASVIETDTASITYKQSGDEIYALNQGIAPCFEIFP